MRQEINQKMLHKREIWLGQIISQHSFKKRANSKRTQQQIKVFWGIDCINQNVNCKNQSKQKCGDFDDSICLQNNIYFLFSINFFPSLRALLLSAQILKSQEPSSKHIPVKDRQLEMSQKAKLNDEEMKMKEMKQKDSRKYFQMVKSTYLMHMARSLQQTRQIKDNYVQIIAQFISGLNENLWEQLVKMKQANPMSIELNTFLNFIQQSYLYLKQNKIELPLQPHIVFWSLCQYLQLPCRKIYFFDLYELAQQQYCKLNYDDQNKKEKRIQKKIKQHQKIKMQINSKIQQHKLTSTTDYLILQDFQYDQNSYKSLTNKAKTQKNKKSQYLSQQQEEFMEFSQVSQSLNQADKKIRRRNIFLRNKNYKKCYFQMFSASEGQWKTINAQILHIEELKQMKKYVLNGKCIIGFYSTRILHMKHQEAQELIQARAFKNICVEDLSMYFYDNITRLTMRKKRNGLKIMMNNIFKKGAFNKNKFLLSSYDQHVMNKSEKIVQQFQLSIFPKNNEEMANSNFYFIESMLPKYNIIRPSALPIEKTFNQEPVYIKKDLIKVSSKHMWIQKSRKVKQGEIPVKKTQNKNKNYVELFLYEQTEEFSIKVDEQTGDFKTDDQYKSIDIPPNYVPDPRFIIIENPKLLGVLSKNKIRNAKVIQGFTMLMFKILPNVKGYIIYRQDEKKVLQLWQQRQANLDLKKKKQKYEQLTSTWTQLLKKIQLQQLHRQIYNN